jgi:hypothetical protein
LLALAAPFAGGSDAAYHAVERVTEALMSASADIRAFERKASDETAKPPAPRVRLAQSGEDWLEALRTGSYWKKARETGRGGRSARREKRSQEERKAARSSSNTRTVDAPSSSSSTHTVTKVVIAARTGSLPRGNGDAYRTVCVRLCDGYYWPISFATDSSKLTRDSAKCEKSCSMPAKLYYAPMLGEAPELIDLNGEPYTRLGTAFQFRIRYNPSCKCRAHPWETVAQQRHETYAVMEAAAAQSAAQESPVADTSQVPAAHPATDSQSIPRD